MGIVLDDEAIHFARRLAREEGLFVGINSVANLPMAMKLLAEAKLPQTTVVLPADTGLKHLTTDLCADL